MTTFIEKFSEQIDYSSFNQDEQVLLDSVRPLLEKSTHSSLSEAAEILEQVFAKNKNKELLMIIFHIYSALENKENVDEWIYIHTKKWQKINAMMEAVILDYKRKNLATIRRKLKVTDEELNANTLFNEWFNQCEIDTQRYQGKDFDKEHFKQLEKEFISLLPLLPKPDKKADFKMRKLGKHKALGLYCISERILAIDTRDQTAFIHEWGHMLDYSNGELSSQSDFYPIIKHYRLSLNTEDLSRSKTRYYKKSCEIFARAFEFWADYKGYTTPLLAKNSQKINTNFAFLPFQEIKDLVIHYFDNLFEKTK